VPQWALEIYSELDQCRALDPGQNEKPDQQCRLESTRRDWLSLNLNYACPTWAGAMNESPAAIFLAYYLKSLAKASETDPKQCQSISLYNFFVSPLSIAAKNWV